MKVALIIIGIVLIAVALVSLAYQGITYTSRETVLKLGPIKATKETEKTIPRPPILGGAALAGGIAGGVGGSAGWRAAYAAPLVLTAVIVALARGFDPRPALGPADDAGTTAEAEAGTAPA